LSNGIKPTILYSTRKSVERINKEEFDKLPGDEVIEYETTYEIIGDRTSKVREDEFQRFIDMVDRENNYDKSLQLAVGAQVMLLKNIDQEKGLVNGSRGVVIDFESDFPVVKFMNNEIITINHHEYSYEISSISQIIAKQIPLALAWCTTIHKSQGQSLDCVRINIGSGIFEYGQTYVALSRARTLEGLFIEEFDPKKIRVHPKVADFFGE
jgi:ATP-dependent DNA helicase PIF1